MHSAVDRVESINRNVTGAPVLAAADFKDPSVLLSGPVDQDMYARFREQLEAAPCQGLCTIELSTLGGDPEVARMMGEDVRFHSEVQPERRLVFLGKAAIYSAGTTFMSFFARENRYLTRGTRLMVHERIMTDCIQLNGPLTSCIAPVQAKLSELTASIQIQREGFENLIRGSDIHIDEVLEKAPWNWYISADDALRRGLVQAII